MNLSEYDINQCEHDDNASESTAVEEDEGRSNQISGFAGTHKCHRETSQVENAIYCKNLSYIGSYSIDLLKLFFVYILIEL